MVTVKLNMFGCGEVAIDGFSALAFMNAFATAGRVGWLKRSRNIVHLSPSISRIFAVNLRGRTALPFPEDCCGSFIGIANARFPPNGESNVQIHDFVGRILDGLRRSTISDIASVSNADDLDLMLCNDIKEGNEAQEKSEAVSLSLLAGVDSRCKKQISVGESLAG
ncbi:hypothetical protein SADUNF_Sadunf07G0120200 [Salix dunnii]|uniref:Uncharacterized protein n=1 Tax=Salix dunnii TaxID=1413687 RepID=A0A835JWS8_9ROSI|nr:hypothetical protein SADUNF_Sadunf07G0120200 [Salix dunnii]